MAEVNAAQHVAEAAFEGDGGQDRRRHFVPQNAVSGRVFYQGAFAPAARHGHAAGRRQRVAKALTEVGLWDDLKDRLAKMIPDELNIELKTALEKSAELRGEYENNPTAKRIIDQALVLEVQAASRMQWRPLLIVAGEEQTKSRSAA